MKDTRNQKVPTNKRCKKKNIPIKENISYNCYFRATDEKSEKKEPQALPKVYPEGNWQRKTSYALGEYLKIEDQVRPYLK